jgi:plasmid stability protein
MAKRIFSGIYQIRNLVNGKVYVGQSANLWKRRYEHFSMFRNNKHPNKHLQNAFNKYGEENFVFEIVLICEKDKETLTYYEQSIEDFYKKQDLSYNIRECVDSNLGLKLSEETKQKLSEALSGENHPFFGKPRSEETKNRISESNKGREVSQETRDKISESLIGENHPMFGKHWPEETINKMSMAQKGHFVSDEARKNMSEAHKGEKHPEEQTKKIADANRGQKRTEEVKKKMSIARTGIYPSEESKKKMSESHKGKTLPEEQKKKISDALSGKNNPNYGKKISEESRNKMIETKTIKKEIIMKIKEMIDANIKIDEICDILKVSRSTVYKFKSGGYKNIYGI